MYKFYNVVVSYKLINGSWFSIRKILYVYTLLCTPALNTGWVPSSKHFGEFKGAIASPLCTQGIGQDYKITLFIDNEIQCNIKIITMYTKNIY